MEIDAMHSQTTSTFPSRLMSEHLDQFSSRLISLESDVSAHRSSLAEMFARGEVNRFTDSINARLSAAQAELRDLRRTMRGIAVFARRSEATRHDRFIRYEELARSREQFARLELELASISTCLWQRHLLSEQSNLLFARASGYTDSPRLFSAVDATVSCLMREIFGTSFLARCHRRTSYWMPLTLLGRDYSISSDIGVAYIPKADLHRSRMWPLFAHELAHLRLRQLSEPLTVWCVEESLQEIRLAETLYARLSEDLTLLEDLIRTIISKCAVDVLRLVPSGHSYTPARSVVLSQAEELICDAVATYVCGPAMLLAFGSHVSIALPTQADTLSQLVTRHSHPLSIVRMRLMRDQLHNNGFGEWLDDNGLDKNFWLQRDTAKTFPPYHQCLLAWTTKSSELVECLQRIAAKMVEGRTTAFGRSDLGKAESKNITSDREATISHVLMRAWTKRLAVAHTIAKADAAFAGTVPMAVESHDLPINPIFYAIAQAAELRHEWLQTTLQG
jgi:hypothetical protein